MKLSDAGELSLLEILRKRFGKKSPGIILGIETILLLYVRRILIFF